MAIFQIAEYHVKPDAIESIVPMRLRDLKQSHVSAATILICIAATPRCDFYLA